MEHLKPYDIGDDELMSIDNISQDDTAEEVKTMKEAEDGNNNNSSGSSNN